MIFLIISKYNNKYKLDSLLFIMENQEHYSPEEAAKMCDASQKFVLDALELPELNPDFGRLRKAVHEYNQVVPENVQKYSGNNFKNLEKELSLEKKP